MRTTPTILISLALINFVVLGSQAKASLPPKPGAGAHTRCNESQAAQLEMTVASNNLANMNTTRTAGGGAYKKKVLKRFDDGTCQVVSVGETKHVYAPNHPDADESGYVEYPDISPDHELDIINKAREKLKSLRKDGSATNLSDWKNAEVDVD